MRKRISLRFIKYFLVVLCALVLAFMFHLDRDMNMDFNRWQDFMDIIRSSDMNLADFVLDRTHILKWFSATQPYMYSFNTLLYVISKYFKNNYVMVWVCIAIDYSIIAYIAYDWRHETHYKVWEVILSILICFALLPIIHACSGLRTATAACFMALAVYLFLYRNSSVVTFFILSLLSITFHPNTAFAIPIALVIKLSTNKIVFYITVLGCIFISRVAGIFANSGIPVLMSLATKYFSYTSEYQFRAYRFAMYGVILFSALTIIYYIFAYKKKMEKTIGRPWYLILFGDRKHEKIETNNRQKLFLFFSSYMALLIGNIDSYEMVCRGGYLIGASAPIITHLLFTKNAGKDQYLAEIIRIIMVVLLIYMCFSWIRYYYPYFVSFKI